MKKYNSIKNLVANLEKEITNYAEELETAFAADETLVDFTGFDFDREQMTADIVLKTRWENRQPSYNRFKVVAYKSLDHYSCDVVDGFLDEEKGQSWGAMMTAF